MRLDLTGRKISSKVCFQIPVPVNKPVLKDVGEGGVFGDLVVEGEAEVLPRVDLTLVVITSTHGPFSLSRRDLLRTNNKAVSRTAQLMSQIGPNR